MTKMEITKTEPPWSSKYNEDGILEVPRVRQQTSACMFHMIF